MDHELSQPLSRRSFLRATAFTMAGLSVVACAPAASPSDGATGSQAPGVSRASVATNDFEAAYEEIGRQWEGVTLRCPVGGGNEGHFAINRRASERFTELTGIETEWEDNAYDQVYDKTFLDLGSQGGTYDILDLNFAWFGQFIATDGLLRLEDYVTNPAFPSIDLDAFIPAVLEVYAKWEGNLYGLPWLGDAMIFPYNRTHFEEAGLNPDAAPSTWNEVYEFGKELTNDDRYGFALMGGRQIQAMCTYAAIFFGLAGKGFYNDAGEPQFDSEEGQEAMEIIAVKLPEISPPAAVTWDILQASEAVAQGACSMEIQWPGILNGLIVEDSPVLGQMGFSTPPGGTPLGGHGIGVSNYSQNKDAAYLLSHYLVSPEIQRQYVGEGYAITLTDLFNDPEIQAINPYLKTMGEAMAIGLSWPRTEESNEVFDIMIKHINGAITGEEAPAEATQMMNNEILELRKERGYIG